MDWTGPDRQLKPGQVVVLVKDRKAFERRYGTNLPVIGEYDGKLSNGGERLRLSTASGTTIYELDYNDKWHKSTDGKGRSLEAIDLRASRFDRKRDWRPSADRGGSPGTLTQS